MCWTTRMRKSLTARLVGSVNAHRCVLCCSRMIHRSSSFTAPTASQRLECDDSQRVECETSDGALWVKLNIAVLCSPGC